MTPKFFRIALLAGGLLCWSQVQAVLTIRITQGIEGALPIAVVPFGSEGTEGNPPEAIGEVIVNDLRRSGLFSPLPVSELPGRPHDGSQVDFRDWRRLGTENLVVGRLKADGKGGYTVQFQLFDVFKGVQVAGYTIPSAVRDLRRTAHHISDIIFQQLTGERGAFDTHIAYVLETRDPEGGKHYALQVADSDGYNPQSVVDSTQPLLSPAWSPDGRKLAYVSFEEKHAAVYVQDLASGTREKISDYPGINSAPAWSPDGMRLALTLSKDGNPEIYILDLPTRALRRVTRNAAIDTEPDWAADGKSLTFTSDRGGRPQVYQIPVEGGRARRLTFEGNYNADGHFSPDGEQLVMVHTEQGAYRIALLDLQSGGLRILSDTGLDESPSFAPNGAMIIYATGKSLAAVSVDGRVHQRLSVQEGTVREPAWSPFLSNQ